MSVVQKSADRQAEVFAIEEWNEAYVTVESYLCALGLRNKLLLSRAIQRVLERAEKRVAADHSLPASQAAMEEAIHLVAEWFSATTGVELPENRLAARGRLALLLADLPGANQPWFLAAPPLPAQVVASLRESYLFESPGVDRRAMTPRPITLNPIMRGATAWWGGLERTPVVKRVVVAATLGVLGTLVLLFFWR